MNIVHINIADQRRGAAMAGLRLHKAQIKLGHSSRMLVGFKTRERADIAKVPVRDTTWQKNLFQFVKRFETRTGLQYLVQPWKGQFLRHPFAQSADVFNLHNIHGGYFSHTILPQLSRMAPLVWTQHDLWGMTGHCSFPFLYECERWETGCGRCPALADHPPIGRDTTAMLWRIKSHLYRRSDLTIVTLSEWMASMIRRSPLLKPFELHCIPHGLDTKKFKPVAKAAARTKLGLPLEAKIVMFASFDALKSRKGGIYLFEALQRLVEEGGKDLLLLTVGRDKVELEEKYKFPIHNGGLIRDEALMALHYAAADVYAGPSLAETFGLVFIEAMACGTPALAFDCTAVSEVVRHMESGYLARLKDGEDLTRGLRLLLENDALREKLGRQSRELVEREYTLELQAQRYLELYQHVIDKRNAGHRHKTAMVQMAG